MERDVGPPVTESVSAGSTRWYARCASETLAASTPMGTENPSGNHLSSTQKTMSTTRPSQNVGVDASRKQ